MRTFALALVTSTLVVSTGCRTAAIYNAANIPLASASDPGITLDDVTKGVLAAGKRKGWIMDQVRPGEIRGSLTANQHLAEVTVTYDTTKFSITYKDSKNLLHAGNDIHKRYNVWVNQLQVAIQDETIRQVSAARRQETGTSVATTPTSSVNPPVISSEARRLVGNWRGTLVVSERGLGRALKDDPAMLRIFEDGSGLRWTLESAVVSGEGVNGSGTVSVAGDEVKMVGTYTSRLTTNRGQRVAIEYTARLEGETLQGTGVGADNVPQRFTLKRAGR